MINMVERHFKVPSQLLFINTIIPAMYNHKRKKIENMLSLIQYCSVKIDIRTTQHTYVVQEAILLGKLVPNSRDQHKNKLIL